MKRFLELDKKKRVGILLAFLTVLLFIVWWTAQGKAPTEDINPNSPPSSKQANPIEEKSDNGKTLMTYQPKAYKDPFKPLVEPVANSALPEEIPPLPENPGFLPFPEPNPSPPEEQASEVPQEGKKIVLKGIMEDANGFSALISLGDQSLLIKTGDLLEGNVGVVAINRDQVVLQKGAEKITLEIGKD